MKTKLLQLQCHFTWPLPKEYADLSDLQTRLEEQIELDLGKRAGVARSYCFLAYVRYLQGFRDDALTKMLKSEDLTREDHGVNCERFLIVTYGNFAWLYYHRADYSQCERYLEKLVAIKEKFPTGSPTMLHAEVYGEKGWTFLKFAYKCYEIAKKCFENALKLEPDDSEWNAGYAISLYRTENVKKSNAKDSLAVKQLRLAKDKNPDDAVLTVLLGLRLFEFGKKDEAKSLIEEALEMDPTNPHVIRYVSKNFRNCGQVDRAILLLKRAIDRTEAASLHHRLALCYKRKKTDLYSKGGSRGRRHEIKQLIDQCKHHLQMAVTLKPNFLLAQAELALLYGENRDMEKAERMFKTVFKEAKEEKTLQKTHFYYGEFQQYHNKSEEKALQHYTESLRLGHDTYDGRQSTQKLKKIGSRRLDKDPNDGEAHGILGLVYKVKGKKDEAIEHYEKALQFDPKNEEYINALFELKLSLQEF